MGLFFRVKEEILRMCQGRTMILLQVAMVGPGTHAVKNHEFQSRANETQLKKKQVRGAKSLNVSLQHLCYQM